MPTRIQIAIVLNQGARWTRLETIYTRLLRSRREEISFEEREKGISFESLDLELHTLRILKALHLLYSDLSPGRTNWMPTRIQIAIVLNQGARWTRLETIYTRLLRSRMRRRRGKELRPRQQENLPEQAKLWTRWFWCGEVDCGQQAI